MDAKQCFLFCIVAVYYVKLSKGQRYAMISKSLTEVPNDIPANVKEISLGNNRITEFNSERISHCYQLTQIRMMHNRIRIFPDFGIGGRKLGYINFPYNGMHTIPVENLHSIESVTFLDLRDNSFTTFPDLTPVGDTLRKLSLHTCRISVIPATNLLTLNVIERIDLSNNRLSIIPDMTPIGNTLKQLRLGSNRITTIDINGLKFMKSLQLLHLGDNLITEFPNICENNASLIIHLTNCPIQTINTEYTKCLKTVKEIYMGHSSVTSGEEINFQNAEGSLETLSITSTEIEQFTNIGSLYLLRTLDLSDNSKLEVLPNDFLKGWIKLEDLNLHGTNLSLLPELTDITKSLAYFSLSSTHLKSFSVHEFSKFRELRELVLQNSYMPFIPTTCPLNPDQMVVDVRGFTGDLCFCHNQWIKSLSDNGADIKIDTISCSGFDWKATDIEKLYENCQGFQKELPSLYSFYVKKSSSNFICGFPTGNILSNYTTYECIRECLDSDGCYSFNYKPIGISRNRYFGDCMLVIPTGGLYNMTLGQHGWNFYQFVYFY